MGQGQLIAQQKLRIAKLQRQIYGHGSERSSRLIDPVGALTFEELEIGATEDELSAEQAVAKTRILRERRPERQTVASFSSVDPTDAAASRDVDGLPSAHYDSSETRQFMDS
ncbi:hypothetical protein CQ13_31435 [Bradyrhizobium retamae]|uniref:Transposase TnpC homeodomain domain-containing protein n=1 Tax=Bradyrhizobium retamae TaxID=1300035 RepID=A0A0R3MSM1_9BRAD|nr:hypothetical protein CQ13_31435 [Bradyrhizobium retamae]